MVESYVDDTKLVISFDLKEKKHTIAHIKAKRTYLTSASGAARTFYFLTQIKLSSWFLEADRR